MPPSDVLALADGVRARLARGDLRGAGPVDLGPDGVFADAELAARVLLADVEHCAWEERALDGVATAERWAELAEALRRLQAAVDGRGRA